MNDVGLGELLVRMIVSLVVVLGLVLAAYTILRRRQGLPSGRDLRGGGERKLRRSGLFGPKSSSNLKGGNKRGLRIVGRVGVGRTSSVVAVQFADRVFMLGTSEQGPPNVLAELELDKWTEATEAPEDLQPILRSGAGGASGAGSGGGGSASDRRTGFLDALREATTRRG